MSLLPSRLHVSPSPTEPKVLEVDGEEADMAFDVLGSQTARAVLAAIYEEPQTPPEIREDVGTSLQNVHYHLDRLEDAGLIEPAGTGYSAKGNEMTVYGPASEAVVLFAGESAAGSRLRDALQRLFGLAVVLALSTVLFRFVLEWMTPDPTAQPGTMHATDAAESEGVVTTVTTLDPVVAFFLGGCVIVGVLVVWWLVRPQLRSRALSR